MRACPFGVAAAACILTASASNAADLLVPNEQQTVELVRPTWAGFYLGAQIGAITDDNNRSIVSGGEVPVSNPPFGGAGGQTGIVRGEIEGRELFGGLHAGYNWQRGSAVFGLEADLNGLGTANDVLGSLRARLGLGSERFLLYGTAGLGFVSLEGDLDGIFIGGNGGNGGNGGSGGDGGAGGNGFGVRVVTSEDAASVGFVGGIGAEFLLSPTLGLGAQALYYKFDFGNDDVALSDDFVTVGGRLTIHFNQSNATSLSSATSPPSDPWSGFYLGGHLGTVHNVGDDVIDSVALANGQPGGRGVRGIDGGGGGGGALAFAGLLRGAGLTGGGHLGYGWQVNSFVLGAEADIDASSNDSSQVFGSVRGRLGWANEDYLLYATGGLAAVSDESVRAVFAGNGGPGGDGGNGGAIGGAGGRGGRALALRSDDTSVGFVVGGGLETALNSRMTAGLEGLYYEFEDRDDKPAPPGPGRIFVSGDDTSDAFVVRTRLSVRLQP